MDVSRRGLLGAGAGIVATGLLSTPLIAKAAPDQRRGRRAKNVIFCAVDGMALSSLTMLDHYLQITEGKRSYWSELLDADDVSIGYQDTRSLNSVVTDSSAASSTWGSGRRIWNGQVNQYPDGTELRPIASLMVEAGVKVGLVTTTTITHATPSGFAVNCVQRDLEHLIAEKYLRSGVSVLMGGGNRSFSAERRQDKRDLYADFAREGFKVVRERSEIEGLKAGKILGIFSDSHLPYTVDRNHSADLQAKVPTLAEMAKVAIDNLKGNRNGFLLQIEGGRVDHGGHANDLAGLLYDQLEFEAAVKVAVDFARKDGDTLVIITADHACGGPALNGAGDEYIEATAGLKKLGGMKSSYGSIFPLFGSTGNPARVREAVLEKLSIELTEEESKAVAEASRGRSPLQISEFHGNLNGTLATVLGNHTKVGWTSGNHTSDHVIVTALGPGSDQFSGLTPNVRFFNAMLAAKGLRHENPPQMGFEEAARHYQKLKESRELEELAAYRVPEDCGCHG